MPIIKSAKKRVRTARKAAARNSKTKRSLREAWKSFAASPGSASHASAQSKLDLAVKKGVMHKNKAARLKRQAAAKAKAAGVKPAKAAKKAAAKPVAAPAKKAADPVKKVAIKAAPKKTAAKKPAAKTAAKPKKTASKKK